MVDKTNISKIFDFLHIVNELKFAKRYGETYDIKGDSSADHSWRLSLMVIMFHGELKLDIDLMKSLKIAIIHDIPESITGDIDYADIVKGKVTKEEKQKNEVLAMEKIKESLPDEISLEIYDLWEEYEKGETREALFIKALDKIETNIYTLEKSNNFSMYDMVGTYPNSHVKKFLELKPVLDELKVRLKAEFEKKGIPWKEEYEDY